LLRTLFLFKWQFPEIYKFRVWAKFEPEVHELGGREVCANTGRLWASTFDIWLDR
jgi:hypothetical protein